MNAFLRLISGTMICALASCTSPDQPTDIETDPPVDKTVAVESVSLTPAELTLTAGETTSLTWTVLPSNATNQNVSWQSSDPAVATVDNKGSVQAIAGGSTVITVTTADGNKTSTCNLAVKEPVVAATGVRLDKSYLVMRLGEQYQLTATVMPDNATDKEVIWSSEHPEVVSVSSSGLLTANARGASHITVKTVDGGWSNECSVSVEMSLEEAEINLSSSNLSLTVGESTILRADIKGEGQFTVEWLIIPDGIVKPSIDGTVPDPEVSVKLTAIEPGTVTVICRVGDHFGTRKDFPCTVEVKEEPD
ncbi:MAG: Ig domain-containing protein [Bacteroidales bacterium]|nr:Ig domain-containing protein [Bacteroidales bacterium]